MWIQGQTLGRLAAIQAVEMVFVATQEAGRPSRDAILGMKLVARIRV